MSKEALRVLIAHHRWWFPTAMSGADFANQEFARKLKVQGVEVRVHGIVPPGVGSSRITSRRYTAEGIPVCLVTSDFIKRLRKEIEEFKPHVIFTTCPEPNCGPDDITRMVETCTGKGLPVVLYVHDIESTLPMYEAVKDQLAAVVTNSHYMADKIYSLWSKKCDVVYPVPDWSSADTPPEEDGQFITFFNPSPDKGLGIAHTLVTKRFPKKPFLFVEGFIDPEAHGIALVRSGNLVHARRSPDVASIYSMSRTVIIPSQWQEPFGRIALESMYYGIPVIASKTGGLPESVGAGGILIEDYANVDRWVEAIELLEEDSQRCAIIENGLEHVKRFSLDEEISNLRAVFLRVIG
jgi:glycosyltransferase involved in cell wall biosynthesis